MVAHSPITIRQARVEATTALREAGIDTAALDARVLLAHALNATATGLLIRDPDPISEDEHDRYTALIEQRKTGVPVAYLIGYREFMGLEFRTAPDVLVPRPDTEPLVEWGLQWMQNNPSANVVDIGTGSGAIAVSIAHHAPVDWSGTVLATDMSEAALQITQSNAETLLIPERRERISFALGSLTQPVHAPVDLLLTNLPYLTPEQMESNPDLRHEPALALDGGADGLDLVREVVADLPRILAPHGAVGFEIDPAQAAEVQQLLSATLPKHRVEIIRDLAGEDRHVVAYSLM